ncbi:retinoic acid receptor responder protein 2 isoform X1 [Anolis carolinensis]|uniref:retinoic acid receptor responder protein 2 isoform X1 n=1 Tax=Anolis carolinensis TaxID=28377 RepID=UPI000462748A|nr:PREDICTED: retinoic acid receptor responder protein 2 [Anolis carolinensis]XP_016853837.1 PREDICTED: retinoic acid receptor responder protein 2 [Anolis carolinensis]|eukprot:XP_008121202.1 PREDICTED: retinoic acid receptor responder protein 2 [Anolis carolinensis]
MKWLLALCGGLLALAGANHSPVQQRALDNVLEYFHGRSFVQSVFQEQAVTEVAKEESSTGTYIHLEVELAQTHCRKQRRAQNCPVKPGGRRQICLACFSFDSRSPDHILDKTMHCISQKSSLLQETKRRHAQECERVKKANGLYLPGQFAFSRGLP